MEIRHKIVAYMTTLDLCDPRKIIPPNRLIPELKVIEKGYVCNFPDAEPVEHRNTVCVRIIILIRNRFQGFQRLGRDFISNIF